MGDEGGERQCVRMCVCMCVCERERERERQRQRQREATRERESVCVCAYMYDYAYVYGVCVCMLTCAHVHSCVCICKMQAQACLTLKASSQRRPVVLEEGDGELTGGHGQRRQGGQTPHDAAHTVCYPAAQGVVANVQRPQQLYATTPTNSHW